MAQRFARPWFPALVAALAAALPSPLLAAEEARPAPPGVPVGTATAVQRDVPIYATGIGTVQAFRSVLVRARVDGTLDQVDYTEGQAVRPGDLLAQIDPRPYAAALAQAQARRAADQASLANARRDLTRYSNLANSDFASRQQVDTQSAAVLGAQANIQADDAAIATAALNLSFCRITSPIEGVVGLKLVDVGNQVHASDAGGLVTITQIRPISLVFTLPQDELPAVQDALSRAGTGERPQVTAFVGGSSSPAGTGELLTLDNAVDASTGTIRLKATFPNADGRLWPGQFANARLRLRTEGGQVTVPPAAVQHGPAGLFVYVVGPDDAVHRTPVTEGYEDADLAVVRSGLQPGARVVVTGQSRLQDGTRVAVRDAGAPPAAGAAPPARSPG